MTGTLTTATVRNRAHIHIMSVACKAYCGVVAVYSFIVGLFPIVRAAFLPKDYSQGPLWAEPQRLAPWTLPSILFQHTYLPVVSGASGSVGTTSILGLSTYVFFWSESLARFRCRFQDATQRVASTADGTAAEDRLILQIPARRVAETDRLRVTKSVMMATLRTTMVRIFFRL